MDEPLQTSERAVGKGEPASKLVVRGGGQVERAGVGGRVLTADEFHQLAAVPAAAVWLGNINNANTRRAYTSDVGEFTAFCGIEDPADFRRVTRAHVIAWRSTLESRELAPATIRRKLSAVASLFDHLCNENAGCP